MTTVETSNVVNSQFVFDRRWRKRALIASIIWFLVCLLYSAPATLFSSLVRKFVPQLQFQNVSGSFWNGDVAQAFWVQPNGQVIALGNLEWHLQPWSLLWLHPSGHVSTHYGEQFIDTRLRISPFGQLALTQTSGALPAALLSNWAPIAARGQIALKLDRAELSRAQVEAIQGTFYWQQAQWQWNTHWLALGDYRCELTMPAAQQLRCAVQGQGLLAIDGAVDANTKERNWSTQLQVKIDPALPEDFRQSLQLMLAAQPDAQGEFSVTRNGRW